MEHNLPPYVVFVDQMTGELLITWTYHSTRTEEERAAWIKQQVDYLERDGSHVTWFYSNNPEPFTK